ncbi:MAG: hypothetical protein GC192_04165 [Bacteroidetes bacterium]|nr:hypothetical protein [Bacteroidota bacterium]
MNAEPEKAQALVYYRDLLMTTIDYYLSRPSIFAHKHLDAAETRCFHHLKLQSAALYHKDRLAQLKRWFRDLTEPIIESHDFIFDKYLQETTGYQISVFKSYRERVEKILKKGKISTDNQ